MSTRPFLIHALSPLHAGTGQSVDVIDLPIARMRSTGIPILPGSSIKGVLRDTRHQPGQNDDEIFAVFGPETLKASDHAGAIVVGDARLLALPVRSFRGTFAWVTSPLLLRLAQRDLQPIPNTPTVIPVPAGTGALLPTNSANVLRNNPQLFLEDLDLPADNNADVDVWANFLALLVSPGDENGFKRRLVIVDDETMTFLWETATQIDTRVRINPETRTVAKGALWIEESLPPESVLLGLMSATQSRNKNWNGNGPNAVLDVALSQTEILQFGGDATVGRGRCRIVPWT